MLKSTCISIVVPLTHLFNLSLSQGRTLFFPSLSVLLTWTIPQITDPFPFYIISKLPENVHSLLYKFCLKCNFISSTQFGFLPHLSPSSALLFASHSFHSLLQTNKSVGACFPNLMKAFDSIPHKQLTDLLSSLHFSPCLNLATLLSYSSLSTDNHLRHQLVTTTCDF